MYSTCTISKASHIAEWDRGNEANARKFCLEKVNLFPLPHSYIDSRHYIVVKEDPTAALIALYLCQGIKPRHLKP